MSWIDIVMDLLCRIYQDLGGDCKDLYANPSQAPTKVVSAYTTNGTPTFAKPDDEKAFLEALTDLETELASPDNTLSPADTAALTGMIAGLRKDLGA